MRLKFRTDVSTVLAVLILGGVLMLQYQLTRKLAVLPQKPFITIGSTAWSIMGTVTTPEEQAKGLSFQESLPRGSGMLFAFSTPGKHAFWMKDMRFPLDLIFINGSQVDSVSRERQPGDLRAMVPVESATAVLEVNAGEAAAIHPGEKVELFP